MTGRPPPHHPVSGVPFGCVLRLTDRRAPRTSALRPIRGLRHEVRLSHGLNLRSNGLLSTTAEASRRISVNALPWSNSARGPTARPRRGYGDDALRLRAGGVVALRALRSLSALALLRQKRI